MNFQHLTDRIVESQAKMREIEQDLFIDNPMNYREVFAAFAEALGKGSEGLTELEKKQAILNHVLDRLEPEECAS